MRLARKPGGKEMLLFKSWGCQFKMWGGIKIISLFG